MAFDFDVPAAERALLTASCVVPRTTELEARAVGWWRSLNRLGVEMPLVIVHDVGRILATPLGSYSVVLDVAGLTPAMKREGDAYVSALGALAATPTTHRLASLRLRDAVVVGLLARLLGPLAIASRSRGGLPSTDDSPVTRFAPERAQRSWALIAAARERLVLAIELLDLDSVLALMTLGDDADELGSLLDIVTLLDSPDAQDAAAFSLELMASLSDSQQRNAVNMASAGGYSTLERRGSLESLLVSEFALDDELFLLRLRDNELLYWGRERDDERDEIVHWFVIDASASMRGARGVFARGVALSLGRVFVGKGHAVAVRFFDSRLHEPMRAGPRGLPVASVLAFRGENGRYLDRCAKQLLQEIVTRRASGQLVVHFITHGQAQVDKATMQQLAGRCRLQVIFVEAESRPEWSDVAAHVDMIAAEDVFKREQRLQRATRLVQKVKLA